MLENVSISRKLWPVSRDGSLSCDNCCAMWPQVLRSQPKSRGDLESSYDIRGVLEPALTQHISLREKMCCIERHIALRLGHIKLTMLLI